jgi:20S proteasome subunit alpha 7
MFVNASSRILAHVCYSTSHCRTAIAVKCKDGVVMGFEKLIVSKMLVEGTCRRLLTIDNHAGMAVSGMLADGRQV